MEVLRALLYKVVDERAVKVSHYLPAVWWAYFRMAATKTVSTDWACRTASGMY